MKKQLSINELFNLYKSERLPSSASIKNYTSLLRIYSRDIGITNIDVKHEQLIKWRDKILSRATKTTFNSYLRQMKALYEVAVEFNYLPENPFKKLKCVPIYRIKPKTISKKTLASAINLCNHIDNGWFWVGVINILYYTGMRRRQLISLKWQDINFKNTTIKLSAQGSKTKREILLPLLAKNINNLKLLKEKSLATKPNLAKNDQVFNITLFSKRFRKNTMTVENVSNFFKKISNYTPQLISSHRLRHTMATNIANHPNSNIKALQQFLGHTDLSVTLAYVHPKLSELKRIQELL